MRIEKIANRQLFNILFLMRTTIPLSTLPVLTSGGALQDAWISGLFVFVGSAVMVLLVAGLGIRFPRLTVVEISKKLLGTVGGALVTLLILWSFLHLASIEMRLYVEMIINNFLDETPIVFLVSVIILGSLAAAYAGIEVIARLADLLLMIFLVMVVLSIASMFVEADFINLQPVMARGVSPVLEGSITPIGLSSLILVLGILIPTANQPRRVMGTALWATAAASATVVVTAFMVVSVLGPNEGSRAVFPLIKAIRAVELSQFLQRIEILTVFAWGFGLLIAVSVFIYCGARGVEKLFGLKGYRFLLLPMGVTWVVITIHNFENMFEFRSFQDPGILGLYGIFLLLFPYTLLWASYLLRKLLGQNPAEQEEEANSR